MDVRLSQENIDYEAASFVFDECIGFDDCEKDAEKRWEFIQDIKIQQYAVTHQIDFKQREKRPVRSSNKLLGTFIFKEKAFQSFVYSMRPNLYIMYDRLIKLDFWPLQEGIFYDVASIQSLTLPQQSYRPQMIG